MSEANQRVTVIVSILGVVGTLGAAVIGNWDKLFPPPSGSSPTISAQAARTETPSPEPFPSSESPQAVRTESRPVVASTPNIGGVWRDADDPRNGAQFTQQGPSFQFTRRGVLPNGIGFESSGGGTIAGQHLTSTFSARYQGGATSTGNCTGTVSPDGQRMDLRCTDSMLGTFSTTGIR